MHMADVLSQQQIDELLNSFSTQGAKAFDEIEEENNDKKIKNYDFKMPKKFTKEKLHRFIFGTREKQGVGKQLVVYALLICIGFVYLYPVLYMISTSFMSSN